MSISLGNVATHLRCGGQFVANFVLSVPEIRSVWSWCNHDQTIVAYFFDHSVSLRDIWMHLLHLCISQTCR